jgi:hypothetical protein|tara:strand:- start:321 stop:548 length:228 start_codon:yes stop_codon:yes gene_type:complete
MKTLLLFFALICLPACQTFNAAVDGGQHIVNNTIQATGAATANVTEAIAADVTDTITFSANGVADGIRKATSVPE